MADTMCTRALLCIFMCLLFHNSSSQTNSQIPFTSCEIAQDTSQCFAVTAGAIYTVGKEVQTLGDMYRFCLAVNTVKQGVSEIRVVLALDASASMCRKPSSCCGSGDGTLNCENNDLGNKRIEAAHLFVEKLRERSPNSQVGIVVYSQSVSYVLPALSLLNDADVAQVHSAINQAACGGSNCGAPCSPPYAKRAAMIEIPAEEGLGKEGAAAATYPGLAIQKALEIVDDNFAQIPADMVRHIIILTDGAWDDAGDRPPSRLISNYQQAFPGRVVPIVHGVYLSDSATHVAHGYPAEGCSGGKPVDLTNLSSIAALTQGYYFPGTTPQTIVQRFQDLLGEIVVERQEILKSVTVTNLKTGESHSSTSVQFIYGSANDYLATVPQFALVPGENKFEVARIIQKPGQTTTQTIKDVIIINKTDAPSTGAIDKPFAMICEVDSTILTIECKPTSLPVKEQVTVRAFVSPADSLTFQPGDILVRALTPFPDQDNGTVSTYHLDGNLNDARGRSNGSGNAGFSGSDAAFGSSVTSGSFIIDIPELLGDFTIEAWVKPSTANRETILLTGSGVRLGITAAGNLYFTVGTTTLTSTINVDPGTWSHMAVSGKGGNAVLYINGLAVCSAKSIAGIPGTSVTVTPPSGGAIDELRVSSVSRTETIAGITQLAIPHASGISWTIGGQQASGANTIIPSAMWSASPKGSVQFQFSSPVAGGMIISFLHANPSDVRWAKNGNPVTFQLSGVPSSALLYDQNGEGHLDRIDLVWTDASVNTASLSLNTLVSTIDFITPDGKTIKLQIKEVTATGANSVRITLVENTGPILETDWKDIAFTINGPVYVKDLIDKAGPVVNKGIYTPGAIGQFHDTLAVLMSEPVNCAQLLSKPPSSVFYFYDNGTRNTGAFSGAAFATSCGDSEFVARVLLIVDNRNVVIVPGEDQIQLAAGTTDKAGNPPADPSTSRRGPIEWGKGRDVLVNAGTNPFVPGKTIIPEALQKFYNKVLQGQTRGILVGLQSRKPLVMQSDGAYGSATIYDAVGNVVRSDLPLAIAESYKDYGIVWDGKNENGRFVGRGAYLFVITGSVVSSDGTGKEAFTERIKIGVKR